MNKKRVIILAASILGVVSAFLPWVTLGMLSLAGTDGSDGWIVVGAFAIPLLLALVGNRSEPLSLGSRIASIIFGLGGAGIAISKIVDIADTEGVSFGNRTIGPSPGIGLIVMAASGVAVVVASFSKGAASSSTTQVASAVNSGS